MPLLKKMIREPYTPTKDKLKRLNNLCMDKDCSATLCKDCEVNREYKELTNEVIGIEDLNGDDIYGRI